jgi:PAS domain-containing protein
VERLKSLVLIRAKHLAESVTLPMFLADSDGNLIFYNEAAESLVGRPFLDSGSISAAEWQRMFNVRDRSDAPFPLESMPGWVAVRGARPAMGHMRFTHADGTDRLIAVCAFPLFTSQEQFDGALILFWEDDEV